MAHDINASTNPAALDIRELISSLARPLLGLEDGEELPWDTRFEDVGIDSLDAIDLVDRVAEATGVSVPAEAFPKLHTLEAAAAYLEREVRNGT